MSWRNCRLEGVEEGREEKAERKEWKILYLTKADGELTTMDKLTKKNLRLAWEILSVLYYTTASVIEEDLLYIEKKLGDDDETV